MKPAVLVVAVASVLSLRSAAADPQWNAAAVPAVAGLGEGSDYWQDTVFYGAVQADVLFGRSRNSDLGVGPYATVATAAFDDLRLGGGGSLQLPIHPYFPLVLSAGGYGRNDAEGWHPGATGRLFIGSRSYNFHSSYVMAGGLVVGLDQDLDSDRHNAWIVGAQIDGLVLALPFLFAYEWIKGRPDADD